MLAGGCGTFRGHSQITSHDLGGGVCENVTKCDGGEGGCQGSVTSRFFVGELSSSSRPRRVECDVTGEGGGS